MISKNLFRNYVFLNNLVYNYLLVLFRINISFLLEVKNWETYFKIMKNIKTMKATN